VPSGLVLPRLPAGSTFMRFVRVLEQPLDLGAAGSTWLRDQLPPLGSVPVIMMSVSTDEIHHMRASSLRALLFLTKPINQDVLLDQLRGLGLFVTHIPQGEQGALMVEYRTH